MAETFAARWRKRLGVPAQGVWKRQLRDRLQSVPFSEPDRTFALIDYIMHKAGRPYSDPRQVRRWLRG